jgi:branched-chain amino acid transport system ATP-binding protein
MVIVPEGRQIFYKLTVYENLQIGCSLRKDKDGIRKDLDMVYQMFPRLKEREKQYGGLLSGGEQQMLAIARGLMARPRLMMLDEPSLGLAPIIVNQIMDILRQVGSNGTTILLIEQNARKALQLCDRAYLMNVGHVVAEGTGQELLADEQLMQAYLG